MEHLNCYYASAVLLKISRALKLVSVFILTTPNVVSLYKRLRLLLGKQPVHRYHVREYTIREAISIVKRAGFEVVKAYYSIINDLTLIDADLEEHLDISSFKSMAKVILKKPTKQNISRLLAYPIVKLRPSLRQLIVVVAVKAREPIVREQEIWG